MRDLREVTTGNLPAVVEGRIEIADIDTFDQFFEDSTIPAVDVGAEEGEKP